MSELFETFRRLLVDWLEDTHLFPTKNLHIDLILNPHAGALRHHRQAHALVAGLQAAKIALQTRTRPDRVVRGFVLDHRIRGSRKGDSYPSSD